MPVVMLAAALRQLFTQLAQIHFQPSARTGLVMLVALTTVSPWAAVGMFTASGTALLVSRLARLDHKEATAGLFGYNACLTGAGLFSLYAPGPRVFAYLIGVSVLSTLLSARWVAWGRLPALTAQFVLAMWGALALQAVLGTKLQLLGCDSGLAAQVPCSIGQVAFIAGALPGLAVWIAITLWRPREGLWLGIGAATGVLAAWALGHWSALAGAQGIGLAVNLALIAQGLTVFSCRRRLRVLGLGLGIVVSLGCAWAAVPYFTLPFNLVTWALLSYQRLRPAQNPA